MNSFRHFVGAAVVLSIGGLAGVADAAPINLVSSYPDVFVDQGVATYTVSNHELHLTGTAEFTNLSASTSTPITSGTFNLDIFLTPTGGSGSTETFSVASGSLTITGNSQTLFSSTTPLQFGYSVPTDNFQIVFGSGSGTDVLGLGQIGVSYHANGGVSGYSTNYFDANFSTSSVVKIGTADIFNVPEPASLSLLGLAVPLMARRRRRS